MLKRTVLLTATLFAAPAFAQEPKTITMNDVPPAIMAAAQAAAIGVKFEKVGLDYDNGTASYEFTGKLENGKQLEVDIDSDGNVEEIEEQIDFSAVPAKVKALLGRYFPNMQPSMVEKSTRGNFEVFYEFEGKGAQGQELDIEVRSDGQQIMIQDDLAG